MQQFRNGFTLVELLVAVAILSLLILSIGRLVNDTATLADFSARRSEAENQSRRLLDRLAIDFTRMPKRVDLDYFLKTPANPQLGNDQIAFYSEVPGYYPSTGSQSPTSLVAYRINAQWNAERLGKGLLWNGVSPTNPPLVFLPQTIAGAWPGATTATSDADYEIAATNILRFEYYYWLTNGSVSSTPWDIGAGHVGIGGMHDVAAICTAIATIDPKGRALLSDAQLTLLAARMSDFNNSGELLTQWRDALETINDMPKPAIGGIRICQHCFELTWKP